jgi:palmitoyl-protein thioesterase
MLSAPHTRDIIPMHLQPLYKEDWIGLRKLDESGRIDFAACPGQHMQLDGCWEDLVTEWVGGSLKN